MRYDLCCIGHTTIDRVITPQHTAVMPGGTAFYFSSALQAMPVRYLLATALAAADNGLLEPLRAAGIAVRCFPAVQTLLFENSYGANPDQRRQRVLQQSSPFSVAQLERLPAAGIYHLGSLLADDFPLDGIRHLAEKGRLSLDVQGLLRKVEGENVVPVDWAAKREVLPLVHFLKLNEEELQTITGAGSEKSGAEALLAWGAKEVIVTAGSKGASVYTAGAVIRIPAYPPPQVVDATGCGDTFMAGYLFKRSQHQDSREAGHFAAAMAALKLQHSGPFCGTVQEVEEWVRQGSAA